MRRSFLTLYGPDLGIGLTVLGSLISGAVSLWLVSWTLIILRPAQLLTSDPSRPFPSDPTDPPPQTDDRGRNDLATAALAISLSSLLLCGATGRVGAILGHLAYRQIRTNGEKGTGAALAAITRGWLLFAGFLILIGLLLPQNLD